MTGRANKPSSGGLFAELFFSGFVRMGCCGLSVCAGHPENYVHQRARIFFDWAVIKAIARIDRVIKKFGLGVVALLNSSPAVLRIDLLHHQADDVDREGR